MLCACRVEEDQIAFLAGEVRSHFRHLPHGGENSCTSLFGETLLLLLLLRSFSPLLVGLCLRLLRRAAGCLLRLLCCFQRLLIGQPALPANIVLLGDLRIMLGLLLRSLFGPLLFLHQPYLTTGIRCETGLGECCGCEAYQHGTGTTDRYEPHCPFLKVIM